MTKNGTNQDGTKINDILAILDKHDERLMDTEIAIQNLYKAFPSSDTDGHRRYHELIIENTAEKRRLRVAIQEKTISGIVWASIVAVFMAVWHEILSLVPK